MPIYRGEGGSGESSTNALVNEVAQDAADAANSANEAAASATSAANSAIAAAASETAAETAETNAETAETNAASSATAAASSATSAASSATTATTQASAASTSATNAATSETNAATSATNAATSETNAATSATNAATSETNASNSASAASTSATNAATSETNAATSETNAATSATNAATSATNAAASYDDFDDRYLGAKSSDPSVDNDGDALLTGALYFNTTSNVMKVYTGSAWNEINDTLDSLTDVTITSASNGQVLKYNGSVWINDTDAGGIGLTDLSVTTNAAGTAALSYNNTNGVFSYTPPDLSGYLTSYTETDTLDSVTGRGATTTNAITVGNLTSTGIDDNATSTVMTLDNTGVYSTQRIQVETTSNSSVELFRLQNLASSGGVTTNYLLPSVSHSEAFLDFSVAGAYSEFALGTGSLVGGTQTAIIQNTSGTITFSTLNTNAVTIDGSQNTTFAGQVQATRAVLEGTEDPILILRSTDDGPLYMEYERGTDRHAYVGFGGSGDNFKIWNEESAGLIQFGTNNTEAIRIDESQNVILYGDYLELSNGGRLQVSSSFPQHTDLTGGSTNGTDSDGLFAFYGGLAYNTGAGIVFNGADHATLPNVTRFVNGAFVERARISADGTFVFQNGIEEQQYLLTGTVIDPANGTIQYKTLAANNTFTESLSNGEFVTLMIADGNANTITWPTTTWIGGSAPVLQTSGYNVIELWKVNGTLYGAFVGAA